VPDYTLTNLLWRWGFFEQMTDAEPASSDMAQAQVKFRRNIDIIALTSFSLFIITAFSITVVESVYKYGVAATHLCAGFHNSADVALNQKKIPKILLTFSQE